MALKYSIHPPPAPSMDKYLYANCFLTKLVKIHPQLIDLETKHVKSNKFNVLLDSFDHRIGDLHQNEAEM